MREIFNKTEDGAIKDPQVAAQQAARTQLPKRFYENVTVEAEPTAQYEDENFPSYCVQLDGKKIKTPARNTLLMPSLMSAQIVADEWAAQEHLIDAATMPATRLVNTACDGIKDDPQAVLEDMLKFASSDLLCYRASTPSDLVELQISLWDPVLDWVGDEYGARFETTDSLIQIAQPKQAIMAVGQALKQWPDPIVIGALHTFTNLTGSVILALAIASLKYSAEEAWKIAHVDEDWNVSSWGEDEEAKKRRDNRWKEMEAAYLMFLAIKDDS